MRCGLLKLKVEITSLACAEHYTFMAFISEKGNCISFYKHHAGKLQKITYFTVICCVMYNMFSLQCDFMASLLHVMHMEWVWMREGGKGVSIRLVNCRAVLFPAVSVISNYPLSLLRPEEVALRSSLGPFR